MQAKFTRPQQIRSALLFPFNLIASAIELIFSIPWVGRFLKMLWNSVVTALHFAVGLIEYAAWQFGIQPVKKLKVGVVILSDEEHQPLEDPTRLIAALERTAEIFEQAKVKLLPAAHIPEPLANHNQPCEHWLTYADPRISKQILDVSCDLRAILEDFSLAGANYQWINLRKFFFTSFRRVFGYGSPVTIFIVRKVADKGGCSMGWFSDYVTIPHRHLRCIPHELGHACNLFHRPDPTNLMYPRSCSVSELTPWQIAVLRSSRHVTIL
ncbi:MAG: hypothetical protein ABFS17_00315 [Chloroflexota bacterium]